MLSICISFLFHRSRSLVDRCEEEDDPLTERVGDSDNDDEKCFGGKSKKTWQGYLYELQIGRIGDAINIG